MTHSVEGEREEERKGSNDKSYSVSLFLFRLVHHLLLFTRTLSRRVQRSVPASRLVASPRSARDQKTVVEQKSGIQKNCSLSRCSSHLKDRYTFAVKSIFAGETTYVPHGLSPLALFFTLLWKRFCLYYK